MEDVEERETGEEETPAKANNNPWGVVTKGKPVTRVDFKECLREAVQESRIEAERKAIRDKNVIIHNCDEVGLNEERKQNDSKFVETLINKVLEANVDIIEITRLGNAINDQEGRKRPLKITFSSSEQRIIVMSKLRNLKNAEKCYNKIRVTSDMNRSEREEVRRLVDEAKNLTAQEKTQEWIHIVRDKKIIRVHRRQHQD